MENYSSWSDTLKETFKEIFSVLRQKFDKGTVSQSYIQFCSALGNAETSSQRDWTIEVCTYPDDMAKTPNDRMELFRKIGKQARELELFITKCLHVTSKLHWTIEQ